jgi:hypothetical protein
MMEGSEGLVWLTDPDLGGPKTDRENIQFLKTLKFLSFWGAILAFGIHIHYPFFNPDHSFVWKRHRYLIDLAI